ncbi:MULTISPECIES: flagellar hook assembly protein FlgD [Halomonadaceae]|uniref:flagellar hook assembly protein FlgD n=1 Tax=Halomonadaceae TaxID=28256 RepID=UPI001597BDE3|nr:MULTISPECIES: flagellar hook assembly protein FlgD [unclassified Halomonas]QJQ94417.1 flagellar hook assembly protein FlgD [Halomonas sp. PA5]
MSNTIDNSVLNSLNTTSTSKNQSASNDIMNDFMTLLITQMQHQDPLDPMDNHNLTSQIAQINTVAGIEKLETTLKGITSQIDASQMLQASGLIGQGVLVPGDRIQLAIDESGQAYSTPFGVELAQSAENVKVTITNASGQVINQYDIGPVSAGVESFSWDGKSSDGQQVTAGSYRVSIEATSDDKAIAVDTLNYAVVGGVTPSQNGSVRLDLGAVYGQVALSDVKQIL